MGRLKTEVALGASFLLLILITTAYGADVRILGADFHRGKGNQWSVNVTLEHADTGWDHYADNWRVVDAAGNILGDRVLYHPHVGEQPFTRSLSGVKVPAGVTTIYIEAHDKVHGWTPDRLEVDLTKAAGGRVRVEAQ